MNTPSPLIPQGSFQQQQTQGKSRVRIAVFLVITLHSVFFTLLLMQGCGGDDKKTPGKEAGTQTATNNEVATLNTNYYYSSRELPSTAASNAPTTAVTPASSELGQSTSLPPAISPAAKLPVTETPASAKEYTIVKGDYLYKIAKDHGVTVAALTKANPGIEPTRLQQGQKIQIPAPSPAARAASAGIGFTEPGPADGSSKVHVVKGGENLTAIARRYGTTAKAIRAANDMKTDRILVGKKLKIPAPQKPVASGSPASAVSASSGATNRMATLPGGVPTPISR